MEKFSDALAEGLKNFHFKNSDYNKLLSEALNDSDVKDFLNKNQDKISKEAVDVSAAAIYEFYNHKKNSSEFSKNYTPQLIVNNQRIEVAYIPNQRKVNADKKKAYESGFALLNMPSDIRKASLNDYDGTGRQEAFMAAVNFIQNYQPGGKFVPGLYLAGDFGVGKTYLLGAIANELYRQNIKSTLVHFPSFQVDIKNSIQDNKVMDQVNAIKDAQILMIDDIGADSISGWIRDEVLGVILQYRMQESLPTFFSSNFSMNELEKHLADNKNVTEPVKAARIMERIKFLSREVIVSGPNRRNKG
ncbi:primosomal protein DnaI [Companilactobacillus versmoldensis]|uniref:Primosomal protein DnaI n=1 Tax=Companilactobacillus versmoldensis DSM 14857 = KCTC 3814 TaxID=1423815 RepID=A0A0R1SSZ1_9LACO|nr:primosomal protein DnaI [Companilactobacillus versmoldensis]KRL68331.1 primosomal protein DnaI [Companilactobacillus versmoldensis DSM 14857 = KCTC 3814]